MINNKCEFCKKEFGNIKPKRYCSKSCIKKAYVSRLPENTCEQCGIKFKPGKKAQRFCSRQCQANRLKCDKKICPICKKEYEPERRSQKYCSRDCCTKAGSPLKGKYITLKPKLCAWCKKEFHPKEAKRMFCSLDCKRQEGLSRRIVRCKICGKEFKRHYAGHFYCSLKCWGVHNAGINNASYKNGLHKDKSHGYVVATGYGKKTYQHIKVFNKESKQVNCAICNSDIQVIHHIDGNRTNNVISNLIGFCNSCHIKLHAALRRVNAGTLKEQKYIDIYNKYNRFISDNLKH